MAVHFGNGEFFEPLIHQGFFHKTKPVWANDGLNLVHGQNSFVSDGRSNRSAVVQTSAGTRQGGASTTASGTTGWPSRCHSSQNDKGRWARSKT